MQLDRDLYRPLWEVIEVQVRESLRPNPVSRKIDMGKVETWKRIRQQFMVEWAKDFKERKDRGND